MKISDSLGNLYTHTMFKKKSYEMKDDADEITVQVPSVPSKQKHHHHHQNRNQRLTVEEEDEESEDESVTSERSEDSISTKSSHHAMSRRQSERRREAASRSRSGVRLKNSNLVSGAVSVCERAGSHPDQRVRRPCRYRVPGRIRIFCQDPPHASGSIERLTGH